MDSATLQRFVSSFGLSNTSDLSLIRQEGANYRYLATYSPSGSGEILLPKRHVDIVLHGGLCGHGHPSRSRRTQLS